MEKMGAKGFFLVVLVSLEDVTSLLRLCICTKWADRTYCSTFPFFLEDKMSLSIDGDYCHPVLSPLTSQREDLTLNESFL